MPPGRQSWCVGALARGTNNGRPGQWCHRGPTMANLVRASAGATGRHQRHVVPMRAVVLLPDTVPLPMCLGALFQIVLPETFVVRHHGGLELFGAGHVFAGYFCGLVHGRRQVQRTRRRGLRKRVVLHHVDCGGGGGGGGWPSGRSIYCCVCSIMHAVMGLLHVRL